MTIVSKVELESEEYHGRPKNPQTAQTAQLGNSWLVRETVQFYRNIGPSHQLVLQKSRKVRKVPGRCCSEQVGLATLEMPVIQEHVNVTRDFTWKMLEGWNWFRHYGDGMCMQFLNPYFWWWKETKACGLLLKLHSSQNVKWCFGHPTTITGIQTPFWGA